MTAQNPNMREDLNTATPQRVADLLRSVRSGDLLAGLVQNGVLHGRRQAAVVALVGASPHAFTFEDLDMLPPAAGQVVWDRGTGLRFAPDDAVSSARVVSLPLASPLTLSLLERTLQQRD